MQKTSQYKGVYLHVKTGKWDATLHSKGNKQRYGGRYNNELDAAKRVNQLCEEVKIPLKNPGISSMPKQKLQIKQPTSQYKGVFWHKYNRKWYATLSFTGQKPKYYGVFDNEIDAAKRVNQICEEFEIPLKNPEISGMPTHKEHKQKTSQYKGVHWHKSSRKWYVKVHSKGQKVKYGGTFDHEIDAAKRVNELHEEFGIFQKHTGIRMILNTQLQDHDKKNIGSEGEISIIDSEITKPIGDGTCKNENKRERKTNFIDNHVKQYYFYDHLLK